MPDVKKPAPKLRKFTLEKLLAATDDESGLCLACGHAQHGCEPDARGYLCESCGEEQVYGAEELIVMGRAI